MVVSVLMAVRLADCRDMRKVNAGVVQGGALLAGVVGNPAGAPDGAAGFRDALERGAGRQVAGVGRVYSGGDWTERARVFAQKLDQFGRGGEEFCAG